MKKRGPCVVAPRHGADCTARCRIPVMKVVLNQSRGLRIFGESSWHLVPREAPHSDERLASNSAPILSLTPLFCHVVLIRRPPGGPPAAQAAVFLGARSQEGQEQRTFSLLQPSFLRHRGLNIAGDRVQVRQQVRGAPPFAHRSCRCPRATGARLLHFRLSIPCSALRRWCIVSSRRLRCVGNGLGLQRQYVWS